MIEREEEIKNLTIVGEALFGKRFQSDLTRALGLSDSRRMRQWLAGDRPIPPDVWQDLKVLLETRSKSIQFALDMVQSEI